MSPDREPLGEGAALPGGVVHLITAVITVESIVGEITSGEGLRVVRVCSVRESRRVDGS